MPYIARVTTPLFRHSRTIRFQDIDAAGIIFFARVYDYFHDAYVEHLKSRGVDLASVLADGEWGAPIAHSEADYKRPLRFGDEVAIEVATAEFGETSVTVGYRIVGASDATRVYCTGRAVHVFIDRATFRPRPIPAEVRAALTRRDATGAA